MIAKLRGTARVVGHMFLCGLMFTASFLESLRDACDDYQGEARKR